MGILIKNFIFQILFLCLVVSNINSSTKYKKVEIFGLKIFSEKTLKKRLRLNKLTHGISHFKSVAKEINKFYYKRSYLLAKTFLINETNSVLKVAVDEGCIQKIIFHNLPVIKILRMRYELNLQNKVYNKIQLNRELYKIKIKYGFKKVYAEIKSVKKYDNAFFQLDNEIQIPMIGDASLPFFDKFGCRYNLDLYFIKGTPSKRKKKGVSYGIKTNYTKGIIPYIKYRYPFLFTKNDLLVTGSSIGIIYGLDLKFSNPPQWTFMNLSSIYHFKPSLKKYFTPLIKGSVYYSRFSRLDLGLSRYYYLKNRGILNPGITLLKKLKIFAGIGGERVLIINSEIDEDAVNPKDIQKEVDNWLFVKTKISFDSIPFSLFNPNNKKFNLTYAYYLNNKNFNEIIFKGDIDFEFKNHDIHSLALDYYKIWKKPPFYHEVEVSNSTFKGFMGKNYHTREIIKLSNEYKISLYRDLIFGGIFIDATWFEGSGYDLFGNQYGIVYGLAGHFILLDQFQFNIFFGKDYLYSTKESQYNLYFKVFKKW